MYNAILLYLISGILFKAHNIFYLLSYFIFLCFSFFPLLTSIYIFCINLLFCVLSNLSNYSFYTFALFIHSYTSSPLLNGVLASPALPYPAHLNFPREKISPPWCVVRTFAQRKINTGVAGGAVMALCINSNSLKTDKYV